MSLVSVNWNPGPRQLKEFRWAAVVAAVLIAVVLYTLKDIALLWCGVVVAAGAAIWFSGLISLTLTRYIYVTMMAMTLPIGMTVSLLLMALFYYGLITPVGLVFRLIGRDILCRRFDPDAPTYWIDHQQVTKPERYFHQF